MLVKTQVSAVVYRRMELSSMSKPKIHVPQVRKHASGQAVVTLPDPSGRRRDVYLGKHGSRQAVQEYARVIAEWETRGRALEAKQLSSDLFSLLFDLTPSTFSRIDITSSFLPGLVVIRSTAPG